MEKTRVLILGGGFGGVYTALEFEKRRDPDFEVTVLSGDNYFLFTPMLHEVAASDLDVTHIVNPMRKILKHVNFINCEVQNIDLANHAVTILHGFDRHSHVIEFEHLVCALGSTTNFYNIPGLEQRAVTIKSLDDAINLRNRLIAHLEEANTDCATKDREPLLTFVVAGGGFAGVETIGSIKDFLNDALPYHPNLKSEMIRVVLVHPGDFVLQELGENLGRSASRKLAERGVQLRGNTKVSAVAQREVELSDGTSITSFTLVWTAGTSPHPLLDQLDVPKERGRIKVNANMEVEAFPDLWALAIAPRSPMRLEASALRLRSTLHARARFSPRILWRGRGDSHCERFSSKPSVCLPRSANARVWRESSASTFLGSWPGGSGGPFISASSHDSRRSCG
jgi:NADH:ubiquinone reductase (H+-translocating)